MTQKSLHVFGEVLFDYFPDGSRVLGGAPFNVAWHLQAFGLEQWQIETTLERPQAFAGRRGATISDREFYRLFTQEWN